MVDKLSRGIGFVTVALNQDFCAGILHRITLGSDHPN